MIQLGKIISSKSMMLPRNVRLNNDYRRNVEAAPSATAMGPKITNVVIPLYKQWHLILPVSKR